MPDETKLEPIDGDILAELEDAGAEELHAIINSLADDGLRYPRRADLLPAVEAALGRLRKLERIEYVYCKTGYPTIADAEVPRLASWLKWEPNGGYWTLGRTFPDGRIGIAQILRGPK